jgi:hypothetical protein
MKCSYLSKKAMLLWAASYTIYNGINKIIPKELPKPVGRWRMEVCNTQMNKKIDLSNEDHCGPCGQYALEKIELKNNKNTEIDLEKIK